MKITLISDTHGQHRNADLYLPEDSEIIVHAGDFTSKGKKEEVEDFLTWYADLPQPHKILIGGNHDFLLEREPELFRSMLPTSITYLENEAVEVGGIRIWGSPITPWFYDWAFNRRRGADIRRYWEQIPAGTDLLLTHGPPHGHGDRNVRGDTTGCQDLLEVVEQIQPKFHVFGHIHEGYGITKSETTTFINASCLNLQYQLVNDPVCIELPE